MSVTGITLQGAQHWWHVRGPCQPFIQLLTWNVRRVLFPPLSILIEQLPNDLPRSIHR